MGLPAEWQRFWAVSLDRIRRAAATFAWRPHAISEARILFESRGKIGTAIDGRGKEECALRRRIILG